VIWLGFAALGACGLLILAITDQRVTEWRRKRARRRFERDH
jgi:hypothetical protein